ncbi:MAG: hypothetical protein RLZ22_111, partial [Verrucomicrobiota bacterium]
TKTRKTHDKTRRTMRAKKARKPRALPKMTSAPHNSSSSKASFISPVHDALAKDHQSSAKPIRT